MKKSELLKIIQEEILTEQGPDPIEPAVLDWIPGGIPTGPNMGPYKGGGNMATPDKGIENPRANPCCGPMKAAIDEYAKFIIDQTVMQDVIWHNEDNQIIDPNILLAAKTAGILHAEMQLMWNKCCKGRVDSNITMTTPSIPTTPNKFTGGGNMTAPVKGIIPAIQGVIDEIKKNRK